MIEINKIYCEDCIETMKKMDNDVVDLSITSPPYFGCRQYGNETLGREEHPLDYIKHIVEITNHIKRVLKPTGSFYLNIGDVYFGTKGFSRNKGRFARKTDHHYKEHKIAKPDGKYLQYKQLLLIPTRIASLMQDNGWILRNNIIWEKANPIPSYSPDRRMPCYEYIFHFVKIPDDYDFDWDIAKKIESHRDLFRTPVQPFKGHPAAFAEEVIRPLIHTTCKPGGLVYDPFMGSGTTAIVASKLHCNFIGSEINPKYVDLCESNLKEWETHKEEYFEYQARLDVLKEREIKLIASNEVIKQEIKEREDKLIAEDEAIKKERKALEEIEKSLFLSDEEKEKKASKKEQKNKKKEQNVPKLESE